MSKSNDRAKARQEARMAARNKTAHLLNRANPKRQQANKYKNALVDVAQGIRDVQTTLEQVPGVKKLPPIHKHDDGQEHE